MSIILGGAVGFWAVWLRLVEGVHFVNTPLPLLIVFLGTLGIQFILLGLLSEMLTRTYFESSGKPTYRVVERVSGQ